LEKPNFSRVTVLLNTIIAPPFPVARGAITYTADSHTASPMPSSSTGLNANTPHSTHHRTWAVCSLLTLDRHAGETMPGHVPLPPKCSMCLMPHISLPKNILRLGRNKGDE